MKRSLAALVIFFICVITSVYCYENNKRTLKSAEITINEIQSLCETGDLSHALKKANDFNADWKTKHKILNITVDRSLLKEIETAISAIPYFIRNAKIDEAKKSCENAVSDIEYLLECEKLTFENIF